MSWHKVNGISQGASELRHGADTKSYASQMFSLNGFANLSFIFHEYG